jgi:hypothetical protein
LDTSTARFAQYSLGPLPFVCYARDSYDFVHRQANYHRDVVHVDYLDYDYEHYYQLRRVEKQLAN